MNPIKVLKYRALEKKQSTCVIVYGAKGAGKSWLSLRFGELIDKNFGNDRVKYNPQDLFTLLAGDLPIPAVVLYDEAGVGSNNRDAQTRLNKHMSFIAQTIRPMRVCIFFTAPSWGLVDAQVRNLMDYAIEVVSHNELDGTTQYKFFKVSPNPDAPTPYKKHLVFNDEFGTPVKTISWLCHAPSKQLSRAYDKERKAYSKMIIQDAAATGAGEDDVRYGKSKAQSKKKKSLTELAEQVAKDQDAYSFNGRLEAVPIMEKLGVSRTTAFDIIKYIKIGLPQQ